jgi:hypothetical protein
LRVLEEPVDDLLLSIVKEWLVRVAGEGVGERVWGRKVSCGELSIDNIPSALTVRGCVLLAILAAVVHGEGSQVVRWHRMALKMWEYRAVCSCY